MGLDNDTRGWIMACVSGVACVAGASIICVDLLVQRIPRYRNWRIQDSNAFLSSSLSLSFGVMLFSALNSMLPSSKSYLIGGGMSPAAASYTLIGCFLGGVIGINIVSRLIHQHMPSQVVDCDHTHDEADEEERTHDHDEHHDHHGHRSPEPADVDEDTPLLSRTFTNGHQPAVTETQLRPDAPPLLTPTATSPRMPPRRPTLKPSLTSRVTTFMAGGRHQCGGLGQCHGYTELCGQECFKAVSRSPTRAIRRSTGAIHRSATLRPALRSVEDSTGSNNVGSLGSSYTSEHQADPERGRGSRRQSGHAHEHPRPDHHHHHDRHHDHEQGYVNGTGAKSPGSVQSDGQNHHHHVPANAFLSIGLQTSIAIALHKLPEGFITYATNHANPQLGFAVFMALFVHNITEGFAMALPLYLAIGSRGRAMLWSSLLGGASQPLGAAIAALWFRVADKHDQAPSEGAYGAMFAVTAGIMTSVALQLFSESLGLTHNKHLCTTFAFVGMGILGISNGLTA